MPLQPTLANLHCGMVAPDTNIPERLRRASGIWGALWASDSTVPSVPVTALPPIELGALRQVLRRLPPRKAPGLDHWQPRELMQLPDEALEALIRQYHLWELKGAWPTALRAVRVALTPKGKATAEAELRPIGILPYIYRVWMAVRKQHVKEWVRKLHQGACQSAPAQALRLRATPRGG